MRTYLVLVLVLSFCNNTFSQKMHWIYFKERDLNQNSPVSEKTVSNRLALGLEPNQESDFGPQSSQITIIENYGIKPRLVSRWLNAVSANLNTTQKDLLLTLPYVSKIEEFKTALVATQKDLNVKYLSYPLVQTNAKEFIDRGWLGDGVDIGVVDGGFYELQNTLYTAHLFKNNRVKGYKDFFEPDCEDFFTKKRNNGELHGTHVTAYIGGYDTEDKALMGLAPYANYYFAKSETSGREYRMEEDNWIASLEWFDSLGVRLVNSSLGYALGFTDPKENYSPLQMDGKTSVIGLGAKKAAQEKGMIIVSAAGNEGQNKKWQSLVSTPGDVQDVISVGACSPEGLKMDFSSIGPEFTDFIKPDVTVFSDNGTSLAAPVITGIVAAMLQVKPNLKLDEIKSTLTKASVLSQYPNNYIGYGWPDLGKMTELLNLGECISCSESAPIFASDSYTIESKVPVVAFHKRDSRNVVQQELLEPKNGKVLIKKQKETAETTIIYDTKSLQIIWRP